MKSSVYINEITPNLAVVDLTAAPTELTSKQSLNGFAFQKTIEVLGLEPTIDPDSLLYGRIKVEGSIEQVQQNLPQLRRSIGLIARYGVRKNVRGYTRHEQDWVGRTLADIANHGLPALPDDAMLMRALGVVIYPFADATNEDGVRIYYGRYPGDNHENSVVRQADGTPLGPYSVRDIGGMNIGQDGLPAHDYIDTAVRLSNSEIDILKHLRTQNDSDLATMLEHALQQVIEDKGMDFAAPTNDAVLQRVRMNLPRTFLEELHAAAEAGQVSMMDVLRTMIRDHIK